MFLNYFGRNKKQHAQPVRTAYIVAIVLLHLRHFAVWGGKIGYSI